MEQTKSTPREIAQALRKEGMHCNCDLDNWVPEQSTGHSPVCRIHETAWSIHRGDLVKTVGVMMHTKEPWPPFIDLCEPATPHPDSEPIVRLSLEDYYRAKICVNALAGWDTATLEPYAQGGAPGNPNLGQKFSELKIARKQRDELQAHLAKANDALAVTAEQRDHAWSELRAIREAIGANPEESTLDEVASKLTYNDEAVSKLISQRDNLLSALELMVERIAEPPEANCSCHLSPPCNDCVEYGGEREAFETAKAEIAEARNAK